MTRPLADAYETFGARLELLAADELLMDAIARAGRHTGAWPEERRWMRRYARFNPGRPAFAEFVFETDGAPQQLCRITVGDERRACEADGACWSGDSAAGPLRIARFPDDAAMPMLGAILQEGIGARVVRYRPGRRCTVRFEALSEDGAGYAKVFGDETGDRVHAAGRSLWEAKDRSSLGFAVARPLRWDAESRTLWQGVVAGAPVKARLFAPGGASLAELMGRALGSLAASGLKPDALFDAAVQSARTARYARELVRRVPRLADPVRTLLKSLRRAQRPVAAPSLVPVHGAPHVHQWLADGDVLGLVDFDRFSLGHAELDIATFIAEMDFEDPAEVAVAAINASFIAGFEAAAGPLDRGALAFYRAHKRFAMACHAAQAVRPDGAERAAKRLARALECLG